MLESRLKLGALHLTTTPSPYMFLRVNLAVNQAHTSGWVLQGCCRPRGKHVPWPLSPRYCFYSISHSWVSGLDTQVSPHPNLLRDHCCLVTKSWPTLCDPMDCSTPGLPTPPHLLEFTSAVLFKFFLLPWTVLPLFHWYPLCQEKGSSLPFSPTDLIHSHSLAQKPQTQPQIL